MSGDDLPREVEIAVAGAGLMGAATAWALARRGRAVALLERFAPGHDRGSSHGSARIVRRAYPDPLYVAMTGRAMALWRELERESGERLIRITGGLDHGGLRDPGGIAAVLARAGVEHELMPAAEAGRRWPGLRFTGPVLFHPEAGTVDAARAVAAFTARARAAGASFHPRTPVLRLTPYEGGVRLETERGTVAARRVVVAAGAWVSGLAGGLVPLPPLTVTQQQAFHFPRRDPDVDWPVVVHKDEGVSCYSLPGGRDGGPGGGRKVAEHDGGTPTTADTRSGVVDPAARERVAAYVREWLPGLEPEPFGETSCLYTSTITEDFVLDREGPLVICSPCSGHGAKFAPLIGELAADLAEGAPSPDPRFTLAGHRAAAGAR
ncbi:sarcosine oxidase [Thermocatellispora tengchongensis]|uniref:Sarcosine oxidase n=1 Tax=Thermocatellispora tengchongensis TaxID=1073253 RepID=A0A840PI14_9ACTN|nr:FAD-dependent oxidoreductase [Thermocatellispora tengchongensis]MBB5135715.1 sarcosine oxidase [Thermocatellispora tengchongensis]